MIEFNIDLKPTKLVRGQGLAKLLVEENWKSLDIDFLYANADNGQAEKEETTEPQRKQLVAENLVSCNW